MPAPPMIHFSLTVTVPQSRREFLLHSLEALLEPTRVQPGCLECRLWADCADRDTFTLDQEWESQAALDRHLASGAYKILVAAIEMSVEPPRIRFDEVVRRAGIEVIEAARRAPGPPPPWAIASPTEG